MAQELCQQLRSDHDSLTRLFQSGGSNVADVKAALVRFESNLQKLSQSTRGVPADQTASILNQIEDFRRHLAAHRTSLKALEDNSSRQQLLQDDGSSPGRAARKKTPQVSNQEEADRSEVRALTEARDQMRHGLEHMTSVAQSLEASSKTIDATRSQYQTYDMKLADAAKALGDLKRKTEEDSKYIWWSFMFFLSVVAYIVLRRLKVFKMIYYGGSFTYWSGSTVGVQLQSVWQVISDTLGIPPIDLSSFLGSQSVNEFKVLFKTFCDSLGIPNIFDLGAEDVGVDG
eukprot:TRINITY_DN8161_c0_g1_i1.p1 TRINITY_DN8161_c0_g1~~TRINITY_DN8161_c0_g1_i1.p1  ORF type:complete len:287 (-),score=60.93 TRINITY_DN8161_c0_g1_i1:129-989(-)